MKTLLAGLLLIGLAGCAAVETPMDDGYQLGDVGRTAYGGTRSVLQLQDDYCNAGDQVARGMLLLVVRSAVPGYPVDGLCTDLMPMLEEATREG